MSEQHPNWCGHHGDVNCTCGLESRLTINSLKSKLAHKQEQCDQLAHENIELEDQLAEARTEVEDLRTENNEFRKEISRLVDKCIVSELWRTLALSV